MADYTDPSRESASRPSRFQSKAEIEIKAMSQNYLVDEPAEEVVTKKPKKKKLTKEQRKQLKAQRELDFKKFEMRAHLKRELELTQKSALRGKFEWEQMCKDIKIEELKEEVATWRTMSERLLAEKDHKIEKMLKDMEDTELLQKRNFARQIEVFTHITEVYRVLVQCSQEVYEYEMRGQLEDLHMELGGIQKNVERMQNNVDSIVHCMNVEAEFEMEEDYEVFLDKRDDMVNTQIEKRYSTRDDIIRKMEKLQSQLVGFINAITSAELDVNKTARYDELMKKQTAFAGENQRLNETESKAIQLQGELQRELLHIEVESMRKLNDLRLEHSYFVEVRQKMEKYLDSDRKTTYAKLKVMTSECYNVMKTYEKIANYGERVLSLVATCRKLQTESEKIVKGDDKLAPEHLVELPTDVDYLNMRIVDLKSQFDFTEVELDKMIDDLKDFWRRQSLVELQNILLTAEKKRLTAENTKFTNFIKSFSKADDVRYILDGMGVKCMQPEINQMKCAEIHKDDGMQKAENPDK